MAKSFAEWKKLFFDRKKVQDAAAKGQLRAMIRYGSLLRKAAQRSMRYRKGPSKPGEPPSAHRTKRMAALKKLGRARSNGALLRELLFFAYDPATKSVVVGPVGFKSRGGPVPALHELGGTRQAAPGDAMVVKGGRAGPRLIRLKGAVRYPARPTMGPALKKTAKKFPEMFRGVVTG
jgi:hypothetical protein